MHIRIFDPLESRKEKKEVTFKSQGSINCQYKTNDVVALTNNDVTRKAVCETSVKSLSKGERNVTSSSIHAKNQRDDNVLYSVK